MVEIMIKITEQKKTDIAFHEIWLVDQDPL